MEYSELLRGLRALSYRDKSEVLRALRMPQEDRDALKALLEEWIAEHERPKQPCRLCGKI